LREGSLCCVDSQCTSTCINGHDLRDVQDENGNYIY
jgi:hypothetical protein